MINLSKEFLEEEYVKKGKSSLQIAKELNCDKKVILNRLKKYNLKTRLLKGKIYNGLVGKRFYHLLVIKHEKYDRLGHYWRCLCDCGKETIILYNSLITNHTKSCGCLKKNSDIGRKRRIGKISGSFWTNLIRSAEKRGYEVGITQEDAWGLFLEQNGKCKLSNIDLFLSPKFHDKRKITASLDRIDNSKGYILGNLQWIHKNLNQMKLNLNNEIFVQMCQFVGDFQNSKFQG